MSGSGLLLASALALFSATEVGATAKHEIVKRSPMMRGGVTVGVRLRVLFRPAGGHKTVVLSLSKPGVSYSDRGGSYHQAHSMESGALLYQFPEIPLEGNDPFEMTFELKYADANVPVEAGQTVGLVSAWRSGKSSWHAWGQWAWRRDAENEFTLPGD